LVRDLSQSREQQGATASSSVDEALAYGKNKVPVSTGEVAAPIVGALVVAPGASDPVVRAELTEAVQTLLGLGANQVIVLPGRKERSR
jgi:stage III sporulation protein AG